MRRFLLSSLLAWGVFASSASSQTAGEFVLSLRNFAGMNTIAGDFSIKPNESRSAHNIDWGRNVGSITKRLGYDSVSALGSGYDSLVGIYGAYQSDGQQFLALAADSAGVGYGGLYSSPYGSKNIKDSATRFWPQWSIQFPTSFAMFQDKIYAVNGSQKGVVYDKSNSIARSFPLNSPGEPKIVPIAGGTAPYLLNGEYRYVFLSHYWSSGTLYLTSSDLGMSVVSTPIRVSNGKVMLSEFARQNIDTLVTKIDSSCVLIYRTKANPGRLDDLDRFYRVGHGDSLGIKSATLANKVYIDSIPDDSLSGTDTVNVREISKGVGIDSTFPAGVVHRYGSPGMISRVVDTGMGLYKGIPKQKDTALGVVYSCTFMDTVVSVESDTGRSLFVYNPAGTSRLKQVKISIPKPPAGVSGLKLNLYRAQILQLGHDSLHIEPKGGKISLVPAYTWLVDTVVVGTYHLVKQLSLTDTVFIDDLPYDSIVNLRTLPQRQLRQPMSRIFSHKGYMFGVAGSNLYYSKLDSGAAWGEFRFISINEDDGDQITDAWPTRTAIVVKKNKSSWNVYQSSDGSWSLSEVSNYLGDIAPFSHAAGVSGHYYLSDLGVMNETDGSQLERTFSNSLTSGLLNNFDKLPLATKAKARAFYWGHEYLLSIGDTTYAFDERSQSWATWGLSFGGGTYYGSESTIGFLPGDTLYFYKPGGKTLYRYGTSELDNGASFPLVWESGSLALSGRKKNLTGIGIWSKYTPADPNDTLLTGYIYNESGFMGLGALSTDIRDRYRIQTLRDMNEGLYFRLKIQKNFNAATVIDGIDLFYTEGGVPERK